VLFDYSQLLLVYFFMHVYHHASIGVDGASCTHITPSQMVLPCRMIEEFMLLANVAVAKCIYTAFPEVALLRSHNEPDAARMKKTVGVFARHSIPVDATRCVEVCGGVCLHFIGVDRTRCVEVCGGVCLHFIGGDRTRCVDVCVCTSWE